MQLITGFGVKNTWTQSSLSWIYFFSLRDGDDELYFTNKDNYMRCFSRESRKGHKCTAFIQ